MISACEFKGKPIHVKIDRLYRGSIVDLRDYVVDKAVREGRKIQVTCPEKPDEVMEYCPLALKNYKIAESKSFISKMDKTKEYRLFSYEWRS